MDEHPGYMVDRPPELYLEEEELSEVSIMDINSFSVNVLLKQRKLKPLKNNNLQKLFPDFWNFIQQEIFFFFKASDKRRGRRPKVDPTMLDPMKLTGEENVSVVNRITGKRVGDMIKL